jgi:hypothetical protein
MSALLSKLVVLGKLFKVYSISLNHFNCHHYLLPFPLSRISYPIKTNICPCSILDKQIEETSPTTAALQQPLLERGTIQHVYACQVWCSIPPKEPRHRLASQRWPPGSTDPRTGLQVTTVSSFQCGKRSPDEWVIFKSFYFPSF